MKFLQDYIDKTILPAASGRISIIYFTSITGVPAGLGCSSSALVISLTTGIIKKLLKVTRKKKKKTIKLLYLLKEN